MRRALHRLVFTLAALIYRACSRTYRLRVSDSQGRRLDSAEMSREIYAVSEGDVLALGGIAAGKGVTVLVAEGRDGDWAAVVAQCLGYRVIRGSSLHRPVYAARRMVSELRASTRPAVMVVDGPLGPAGESKEGVAFLAARTSRKILPVSASASRRIAFPRSWSGIYFPLPFSTVAVVLAGAIEVSPVADRAVTQSAAARVTGRLRWAKLRAEEMVARRSGRAEGAPAQ